MTVTIKIDVDNDAFAQDIQGELARVLREVADKIDDYGRGREAILDANGNTCGTFRIEG
jgi:hypothetical protein